jgi:uncharacterized protein
MNRTFKAAVAALMLAAGFAGSAAAGPVEDADAALWGGGDLATAMRRLRPLAEKGNADAQAKLGDIYSFDLGGVPRNDAAALSWYRKAADQGNTSAQLALGYMYAYGVGVSRDYAAAVSWYRKAADQGDTSAQGALALMYFNGHGIPKDYAAALSWAQKAAVQGDVSGLTDIGIARYNSGDYATAMRLLRPLAEKDKGFLKPSFYLGLMYANGQGVPQDYAAAVSWYRKIADKGYAPAQNNLGVMYETGRGVLQDYVTAVKWYRKAADHNYVTAQSNLGHMYANGKGLPQDYVLAYMWLNLAAARGHKDAAQNRNKISAQMTPAQMAEAQKLGREWLQKINAPMRAAQGRVPLKMDGGTFVVPVQINGTMTLDFVIDSGAADVSMPADVVSTLIRAGTIKEPDFIGESTYVLADGSTTKSPTFTIRKLKVGNTVLENVRGSVASSQGSLLLGQSFLNRFKSWSIDNTNQELLLEPEAVILDDSQTANGYADAASFGKDDPNERAIIMKRGETLGAILRDLGGLPDEIKAILAALGPRVNYLKEGQKIRVLLSPLRNSQRLPPVQVMLINEHGVEAAAALSELGRYVAVDVSKYNRERAAGR